MLHYCFQIYFIFSLCITVEVMCSLMQNNGVADEVILSDLLPGEKCAALACSCDDFKKQYHAYCTIHSENKTIRLSFYDKRNKHNLTKEMFLGLNINEIFLRNFDVSVTENFLEGVTGLTRLHVDESRTQVVPDFSTVKNSIEKIRISISRLTILDGESLQNLAKLKFLDLNKNFIRFIGPDVFKGTENLEELNLFDNRLTFIPPKLLDPMKKLRSFSVGYNRLLHVDGVFSVTLPCVINIEANDFKSSNPSFCSHIEDDWTRIEPLDEINSDVCDVRSLYFRYNSIKELRQSFVSCYINKSNGKNIFSFKYILLQGNAFEYLTDEDFNFVKKVELVWLSENKIRRIDTHTFKNMRTSLTELNLSFNNIAHLNGSVKHMSELEFLNLNRNSIQTFADDEFEGLWKLEYLHLQNNKIKNIELLQRLLNLKNLVIYGNDIEIIRPEKLPKALTFISLYNNPLICDCHFQNLARWLKEHPLLQSVQYNCLRSEDNSTENLTQCPDMCSCKCTDTEDDHLMFIDCSSRNLSAVPDIFRNDIAQTDDNETISSANQSLFLQDENAYPTLRIMDYVSGLNFENNSLESLNGTQLPTNLTHLYLSNNKLRRLPEEIFENQLNLKEVTLSENPWNCDCNALKFKKWLMSKKHIIQDFDNIRCGIYDKGKPNLTGKIIWKLSDFDLCPRMDLQFYYLVPFSVLRHILTKYP